MNGSVLLLLPMILPFIFGLIIGFQKEEKQRNILVFIAMAVEAALVWYLCSGEMQTFVLWRISDRLALVYKTDGLARFFACLISTIWLIAAVFSMEYMKHEHKPARFFMFYTFSLAALMSLCFSENMMTMYLSYEFMTILTAPLVIHTGTPEATRAGLKYLGYSFFGAAEQATGVFHGFKRIVCCVRADADVPCRIYGRAAAGGIPCGCKEYPLPLCRCDYL